ncbi:hypothetical protein C8Q75DRAFT_360477 [Abortiporus biennis]|nr:hypothetical protein C8Q75DRAFT_360477 [Abortiporus biennis]
MKPDDELQMTPRNRASGHVAVNLQDENLKSFRAPWTSTTVPLRSAESNLVCHPEENGKQGGEKSPAANPWSDLSTILQTYDKERVKSCKEDIDTLLVLAALFSAILTAFLIELYKDLKPDPGVVSAQLLLQITQQLQLGGLTGGNITSSTPVGLVTSFSLPPTSLKVNILWFLSLALSLITASIGVLVRQWLREYMEYDSLSPQARVRIRHLRHSGMVAYRVFDIADFLPFLLQIALGLFFAGLSLFLIDLNKTVGWIVTPFIIAWLAFFVVTSLIPAISLRCPYKNPFLNPLLGQLRLFFVACVAFPLVLMWNKFRNPWSTRETEKDTETKTGHLKQYIRNWPVAENELLGAAHDSKDWDIVLAGDKWFLDDAFFTPAAQCLMFETLPLALAFVTKAICQRLGNDALEKVPVDSYGHMAFEHFRIYASGRIIIDRFEADSEGLISVAFLDALFDLVERAYKHDKNLNTDATLNKALCFLTCNPRRHYQVAEFASDILGQGNEHTLLLVANRIELFKHDYIPFMRVKDDNTLQHVIGLAQQLTRTQAISNPHLLIYIVLQLVSTVHEDEKVHRHKQNFMTLQKVFLEWKTKSADTSTYMRNVKTSKGILLRMKELVEKLKTRFPSHFHDDFVEYFMAGPLTLSQEERYWKSLDPSGSGLAVSHDPVKTSVVAVSSQ